MELDGGKVIEARTKEIAYARDKEVWKRVTRQEANRKGWKIIGTRWIDINKGDDERPVYRSRLVGKEYNTGEIDGIFASTPPVEELRYLLHRAATVEKNEHGKVMEKVIMVNDVSRAFFEATATRQICIEIPEEDKTEEDRKKDNVGLLLKSLYVTRAAAINWQEEVAKQMSTWGFKRGKYNPCLYYHPQWKVETLIHGDDFVSVGEEALLKKMERKMTERFEIKTKW